MDVFNPRNVDCPHCWKIKRKKTKLHVPEQSGQVHGYFCAGCDSTFDLEHYRDFKGRIIVYLAKRRNPDYLAQLGSEDIFQNLEKSMELDMGVPFYANIYVIGLKKFEEN